MRLWRKKETNSFFFEATVLKPDGSKEEVKLKINSDPLPAATQQPLLIDFSSILVEDWSLKKKKRHRFVSIVRSVKGLFLPETDMASIPPCFLYSILCWFVPPKDQETVAGDFEEMYRRILKKTNKLNACLTYFLQALFLAPSSIKKLIVAVVLARWLGPIAEAIKKLIS